MTEPRLLADVQHEADRVAFFTRFRAAMVELNAADFWGAVHRRMTALAAAGHPQTAGAVHTAAFRYAAFAGALQRHPGAWPQMVEAIAQNKLEGGVGPGVSDATLEAANAWLNAVLDLFDVLREADALLAAA